MSYQEVEEKIFSLPWSSLLPANEQISRRGLAPQPAQHNRRELAASFFYSSSQQKIENGLTFAG